MIPSRTVTFLFTDIEESTRLWEQHPQAMQRALARHDALLRQAIEAHRGDVFRTIGDAFCATFGTALDGLAAAIAAQRWLAAEEWAETPIRVRMALHSGVAEERDGDFFGPDVNRVARVLSTGRGGQVLLSGAAWQLVRYQLPDDLEVRQLGRFQLKGFAQPESIYQVVGPGLLPDLTLVAPVGTLFKHLPLQTTAFVGRQKELAHLAELLADPAVRLVTILGQGGVGKTRLAIEAAGAQVERYRNGVLFASVETATTQRGIVTAVAETIGFQFRQSSSQAQQLLDYLHEKQILLVLDNFDQALEGAGVISELLQSAPEITILVTSREKLSLNEEVLFRLEGLDYARQGAVVDGLESEALQLFLQGARRVRPGFDPQPGELEQVARICRLVDGLPLGILLAAAWIEMLSPAEIGDEIAHGLDFLSTELRNVPERHRSVRAVIESTWRQLDDAERQVFAALSVFHGGFTREVAQAVTSASLHQLLRLANKSLILRDQVGRFRIHQLPLQFAREKLSADPGALQNALAKHSRSYAGLLSQLCQDNAVEKTAQIMNQVNQDLQNVRAGWRWAAEHGDLTEVAAYSAGLRRFYDERGWYLGGAEDLAIYRLALGRVSEEPPGAEGWRRSFCQLHEILADIAALSGQYDTARSHYDTAMARPPEDAMVCLARLYRKKANTYRIQLQSEGALDSYLAAESALGSPTTRTVMWWQEWIQIQLERAWLSYWQGAWDAVTTLDEQIRPQVERFGTLAQQVNFLNALGAMSWRKHRYSGSMDNLNFGRIAYEKSLESGNPHDIAWSAFTYGFSLLWQADYDRSEELMRAALTLAQENGDFVHQARCLTYLTILYRKRGQVEFVRRFAGMSLKLAQRANMPEYIGTAHGNRAWLAWHDRDYEEVATQGTQALKTWELVGSGHASTAFKWTALWPLIGLALKQQNLEQAIRYASQILQPEQQRLPEKLTAALESALSSWAEGRAEGARRDLLDALAQSDLRPPPSAVAVVPQVDITDNEMPAGALAACEPLTPRETEVLRLIAAGLSNNEIAGQLVVEVSTVKKHVNHLFAKLDVDSRTRAIVRARELELI